MMDKITLKLFEFYTLDAELNGVVNQSTGEKISQGILQEKLSLVTKYWLTDLAKKVAAEKTSIEGLKNDLIKKYGTPDDNGNISIPMVIDDLDQEGNQQPFLNENGEQRKDSFGNPIFKKKINPEYQSFEKDFNELLQTEREVEYKALKLEDFEKVETSENYVTLFKLVKMD